MARERFNWHHILHHAKPHEATPDNKWLRCNAIGMIARMAIDPHEDLHKECPGVPPLDIWTAMRVKRLYIPDPNPLVAMENYMRAVETASDHPKSHPIERSLSALAIHAVDLQRPFIKEGLVLPEPKKIIIT